MHFKIHECYFKSTAVEQLIFSRPY